MLFLLKIFILDMVSIPNSILFIIGTSMMYEQNFSERYFPNSKLKASGIYSETKVYGQKIVNKFKKYNHSSLHNYGRGRGGLFKSFVLSIKFLRFSVLIGSGKIK